jgi:hypothetical protein
MTHTPGPWRVSSLRDTHLEVHPWDGTVVDERASTETVVAEVYARKRMPNARLIAAAPDMLAALKAVKACFGHTIPQSQQGQLAAMIEAVIAKAEDQS